MPKSNDTYVAELETEKAELLAQVANYEKEQQIAVTTFEKQEQLISEKEAQLVSKDEELIEQEEKITKLKERIKVLSQKKKSNPYATTIASDGETSDSEEITTTNKTAISTQTDGISPHELEEEILTKRVENLKDFAHYREQLKIKNQQIAQLKNHLALYQAQLKKLKTATNPNKDKLTLLISLAVIITLLLIFK